MLWSSLVWFWELAMGLRGAVPWVVDVSILVVAGLALSRRRRPPRPVAAFAPARCVAHRGAALDAPENTMAAFKHCVEKGCKQIEVDVRVTRDGKCVLRHDDNVDGIPIRDTDWSAIKDKPIGVDLPTGHKFGTVNICSLSDALDFFVANKVKSIIEIKEADKKIYSELVEAFKKYPDLYDFAIVTSFNPLIIFKIRLMDPSINCALNYRQRCFSTVSLNAVGTFYKRFPNNTLKHIGARMLDEIYSLIWNTKILPFWTGCSAIILHKDLASLCVIEAWRHSNYSVFLWGVNQPLEKHYVVRVLGVPYITDTLVGEPSIAGEMNGKIH